MGRHGARSQSQQRREFCFPPTSATGWLCGSKLYSVCDKLSSEDLMGTSQGPEMFTELFSSEHN